MGLYVVCSHILPGPIYSNTLNLPSRFNVLGNKAVNEIFAWVHYNFQDLELFYFVLCY